MNKITPNIELIFANIIFGISYSIIVRLLELQLSYEAIFYLQIIVSSLIIIPIALLNPSRRRLVPHDLIPIAICGVVTIYGWSLLTLRGMTTSSPIDVASLSTFGPTVTIIAATINKTWSHRSTTRHLTQSQVRSVVIPLLFIMLLGMVVMRDTPQLSNLYSIKRELPIIVAVVCMGVSTVIITDHHERYGTLTILAIYFAVSTLLLPLTIDIDTIIPQIMELKSSMWLLLFPVVTMTLPLYLLYRGALQLTPLHTALYRYIQPIISLVVIVVESRRSSHTILIKESIRELFFTLLFTLLLLLLSTLLIPDRRRVSENESDD